MKAQVTQKYADKLSVRQPLVGRDVTITGRDGDTLIGRVDGENWNRSFTEEDICWPEFEQAADTVRVSFVHHGPSKHHKQDTWDMYPEGEHRRYALNQSQRQLVYVSLALDYGPDDYGKQQIRVIPRTLYEALTERPAMLGKLLSQRESLLQPQKWNTPLYGHF
ncbi:hypothetical protein GF380_01095 [Candidatus Uhrbacteria bacterium]|nr:hypothetical protein [Candidatus Uhrbacteria bacterium]